jgi:electron transfer flavoprotein beta subunit
MGVDRCVLISDPALAGSDTLVTARVLAAAIGPLKPFDFLFFGTRTSDSDTGQVGPQTAAVLNLPFVSGVKDARVQNSHWQVKRTMDDWEEQWEIHPPAAFSIHPKAFAPRPTSLIGVAETYDRPRLETLELEALGLLPEKVGLVGSPTRVVDMEKIKRSRRCEIIEGEPADQVNALMERLGKRGVLT